MTSAGFRSLAALLPLILGAPTLSADPLTDLPSAIKAAETQKKPIFVYVYDDI